MEEAKVRLGGLFRPADYPRLRGSGSPAPGADPAAPRPPGKKLSDGRVGTPARGSDFTAPRAFSQRGCKIKSSAPSSFARNRRGSKQSRTPPSISGDGSPETNARGCPPAEPDGPGESLNRAALLKPSRATATLFGRHMHPQRPGPLRGRARVRPPLAGGPMTPITRVLDACQA